MSTIQITRPELIRQKPFSETLPIDTSTFQAHTPKLSQDPDYISYLTSISSKILEECPTMRLQFVLQDNDDTSLEPGYEFAFPKQYVSNKGNPQQVQRYSWSGKVPLAFGQDNYLYAYLINVDGATRSLKTNWTIEYVYRWLQ